MTNAVLNLVLVIVFHMGVAGVAIGTIVSQLISSILVLRCLYTSNTSYRLYFSKLGIKTQYLKQIFQVGIPAGIQSTVINLSNALLQSSVNSFGSVAMAGYTAANNIFGFLYMSVNAVTQSCMSFTSQNYGVKKLKRMDRVLLDCMILSVGVTLTLGCGAYFFGPELLKIYTSDADVIRCGVEVLAFTTVPYFCCGIMDLLPGAPGNGIFRSTYDSFDYRYRRNQDCVDLRTFPCTQVFEFPVYFLSGILDPYDPHAGSVLLLRKKTCASVSEPGSGISFCYI